VLELKRQSVFCSNTGVAAVQVKEAPVIVHALAASEHEAWDRFVYDHPQSSPFHLIAWKKSIEEVYNYQAHYLVAAEENRIRGVLPLFLVENLLMGKVLMSSPFAVYGGILADSDDARQLLAAQARTLGERLGVSHVEFRNAWEDQCTGLPRLKRYVTFNQRIDDDEPALLQAIPRKTRYMVRKALKEQLTSRQELQDSTTFQKLYSRNLRKLGTPCFSTRHFERLLANFRGMVDIREVMLGKNPIAGVFSFYYRDQILPYYGASDETYNSLAPNNFMYFDLMRWGSQTGYRTFDFGRSKKVRGSYDFKSHWGMMERDLPYEIMLITRKSLPNFTPTNPVFKLPMICWRRLPLSVTRTVGPLLVRCVP
jgi:FemAB-related protein (PEP-CTERM system-associated)